MKVLLATIGTCGDVQPFIALAVGLARRGHIVTVCTSVRYEDAVTHRGLGFEPLSDDLVSLVETPEGRRTIAGAGGLFGRVRTFSSLLRKSLQVQRDLFRDGWSAARQTQPDVIVFHPKMSIALHYAERLAIPAVMAPLFPLFNATSAYPAPGVPYVRFGHRSTALYNRASHHAVRKTVSLASRWLFAQWRKSAGLPDLPLFADVLRRADGKPVPLLNGWSRHLLPDPPNGETENMLTSGFWFLERQQRWQPDNRLVDFLDRGDPPVFVGFGSMSGTDPVRTTDIVLNALDRAGARGVLAAGWGGLQSTHFNEDIFLLEEVPHDWMFERVAAVVHHGGAGTTAAGLRAGRPTVVCPFFGDQSFWAWRIQELGVGPAPVPQRSLNAERLADAIQQAVESGQMHNRADALGEALRREEGIACAAEFLERTVDDQRYSRLRTGGRC